MKRWILRIVLLIVVLELTPLLGLLAIGTVAGVGYEPIETDRLSEVARTALLEHLAREAGYLRDDEELGWTIGTSVRDGELYRSNNEGLRSDRDVPPKSDRLRILTVGDSFTHCDEVHADETWQEYMIAQDPSLEVLNGGVPAYGPGQALLRYRRLKRLGPDVALFGFWSENINRAVNVFRPFYNPATGIPLPKPRFAMDGDRLVLIPSPVRPSELQGLVDGDAELFARLAVRDYWFGVRPHRSVLDWSSLVRLLKTVGFVYRRTLSSDSLVDPSGAYRPNSEGLRVVHGILDAFYREALEGDVLPILVVLPSARDLQLAQDGQPVTYRPLLQLLEADGHRFVDVATGLSSWNAHVGHYPPEANELVARQLVHVLGELGLAGRETVRAAIRQERTRLGLDQ